MGHLHNQTKNEEFRKQLRSQSTYPERLFWNSVRANQLGMRFRRQHSFGDYVLDFYCPKAKIGFEIDGEYHLSDAMQIHDAKRTKFIKEFGIQIVRFTNSEVLDNLDSVIERVKRLISDQTSPIPSPLQGEG